jgi:hypothetical protein
MRPESRIPGGVVGASVSLEDLDAAVREAYGDIDEERTVTLDRETRNELAMLAAALETDVDELVRRGVHALFRTAVDTGDLDFNLRRGFDVTYDEYLAGVTYDEMTGADQFPQRDDDDRRYRR